MKLSNDIISRVLGRNWFHYTGNELLNSDEFHFVPITTRVNTEVKINHVHKLKFMQLCKEYCYDNEVTILSGKTYHDGWVATANIGSFSGDTELEAVLKATEHVIEIYLSKGLEDEKN